VFSDTQTICDCVKLYLEKVITVLESNGYYDYIDNQQFDVTDQVDVVVSFQKKFYFLSVLILMKSKTSNREQNKKTAINRC